jgi:L-rhamnose mutarotase
MLMTLKKTYAKIYKPARFIRIAAVMALVAVFAACGDQQSAKSKIKQDIEALRVQTPTIIEVVGEQLNADTLIKVCNQNNLPSSAVYQWQNHVVIYGNMADPGKIIKQINITYPGRKIKTYDIPFYNFNRSRCDNKNVAKERDNILLTANLVGNRKLQKEYMDYHATQFEKWPEVSKGFCNANFQQLLVFRNGRQLMLVISIPKGESLDKLNPKTSENNPRVDEWNALMKKYQEGISGTKPGEVWAFLKPVSK